MGKVETGKGVIDILSRALEVEYKTIVHYPRIAKMMPDEQSASSVELLGEDSIKHADKVAAAISGLGGIPPFPRFEVLPDNPDMVDFFEKQLELEYLALDLHTKAAESIGERFAPSLRELAEQEKLHIKVVNEILAKLRAGGNRDVAS
jgi:bacterioferritin (cytochrome b1)